MTVERASLKKWRFPDERCIMGDVFPSGRPKFGPFPDVTNVMNANFCPVAILHDLLHGEGNALIPQFGKEHQRGDVFHSFIAHLKLLLKNNQFNGSVETIQK